MKKERKVIMIFIFAFITSFLARILIRAEWDLILLCMSFLIPASCTVSFVFSIKTYRLMETFRDFSIEVLSPHELRDLKVLRFFPVASEISSNNKFVMISGCSMAGLSVAGLFLKSGGEFFNHFIDGTFLALIGLILYANYDTVSAYFAVKRIRIFLERMAVLEC